MEEFYGKLQELAQQVPQGNVLIIIGDWMQKLEKQKHQGLQESTYIVSEMRHGSEFWSSV